MVRAAILDVDGTLMDTNYLHVEAWARAFRRLGLEVPRYEIHRQIGKGSDKLVPEFVEGAEAQEEASELHGEIYLQLQEHGYPLPGAKELIAFLGERGVEVWFATSAKPEELEHHLEELEAEGRISGVVSSGEVEESKPAPDLFREALKRAGTAAEEAVAVGDAIWDVRSAKQAGLRTAAVLTGGAFGRGELEEAGAAAVFRDCAELLESGFLEQW
ncbi:HAD family hydrolase [Rubrobacter taiwanensis]|uniref:HAD family hydrolase n=1 Tax=Rubrobacter taiwanensis TaxID=185139 RepID=A0A4R1BSB8_9ACTN|nr:HAD family hydrolase [Rubrobacter taiwanensis]TCJ20551.1 HAD family hydrolase [Rubrobacter taiwanensis]